MSELTAKETALLRRTLGLTTYKRDKPERNFIKGLTEDEALTVEGMRKRGYMETAKIIGQGGWETYYKATKDGLEAVKLQPWS